MPTVGDRILAYLAVHPDGADDDQLAEALALKSRQQANSRCRQLAADGLIWRGPINGKIRNYATDAGATSARLAAEATLPAHPITRRPWFWEGNVQAQVVTYLRLHGYTILRAADTASRETGRDIEALDSKGPLWVTVKGYPVGTLRTRPSTQAGHWFKQAVFDVLAWRGESQDARLAIALPDYPRYRKLAQKIAWLQPIAGFSYFWVLEEGVIAQD